jgi:hypothetical protein
VWKDSTAHASEFFVGPVAEVVDGSPPCGLTGVVQSILLCDRELAHGEDLTAVGHLAWAVGLVEVLPVLIELDGGEAALWHRRGDAEQGQHRS